MDAKHEIAGLTNAKHEIDFEHLFVSGANTLEIYACPGVIGSGSTDDVVVGWRSGAVPTFKGLVTDLEEFNYRDLVCSYEKASDSQKVTQRVLVRDMIVGNLYISVYREGQVPPYTFPCTTDISHKSNIQRKSLRVNNRLFITLDSDGANTYLYTRYNHSENVDSIKAKVDLNIAIAKMLALIPT